MRQAHTGTKWTDAIEAANAQQSEELLHQPRVVLGIQFRQATPYRERERERQRQREIDRERGRQRERQRERRTRK